LIRTACVVALACAACIRGDGAFHCAIDSDCKNGGIAGTCQSVGYCSFPDPQCANGRYGALSGTMSNQCVAAAPADAAIDGPPIDSQQGLDGPPGPPELIGYATGSNEVTGGVSSCTFTVAVPNGSRLFLLASVEMSASPALSPTTASVTYGGTALGLLDAVVGVPDGSATRTEQWRLIAPTPGSATVDFELANPAVTLRCNAMVFAGVNQTMPVRAVAHGSGMATSSAVLVASATNDLVVSTTGQGGGITGPVSPQNKVFLDNSSGCCSLDNAGGSTAPGDPAGVSMGWTYSANDNWQTIATSLEP
jgi:hypothetical protein